MIKRLLKWSLALLLAALLLGGGLALHTWHARPLSIDWFYSRVFLKFALGDPQLLSDLRILEPLGIKGHNARLSDLSLAEADRQIAWLESEYAVFKSYDREDYSGQAQLSYDIFDRFLSDQVIEGKRFRYHDFPVNQMFGVQSSLPNFMADTHVIDDARDARDYLSRISQFGTRFDHLIEALDKRQTLGILPPRFTVEKVLTQMRDFIAMPADQHMLYTSFVEKLDKLPAGALADADRAVLLGDLAASIESTVYPAYQRLIAWHEAALPEATSNEGVWRLPDGEAFYAWRIRSQTTTDLSADEIHRIGLAEVARIADEMDRILRDEGLTEGSLGERVQQIAHRPDQLYSDDEAGRAQILADYQAIIDDISGQLDPWFSRMPAAPVEVRRVPTFSEKTAPGAYYQTPSLDGKRPGVFYANLRSVAEIPRFGMRTLAYHEAVPGHHFQLALAQELTGLPIFRKFLPFTVYSEGWALYAEQLAWEAGFQSKPLDNLGRLQAEMFRAARLVVDTGMHAKRWTREQAIDYLREHTGMGEDEVVAEIERYLVIPGQALAYKVGMLKLLELRAQAERELGDRFDIRAFHEIVLGAGAVPIFALERLIQDWIAESRT